MKVLLTQFDKKLGNIGDIVNVSDGLANNLLFPQRKATPVTPQALAQLQKMQEKSDQKAKRSHEQHAAQAQKIDKKKVTIQAKAKDQTLFGSITTKNIAQAITQQYGVAVDQKMVDLDEHIKELTTREVGVDFGDDVRARVIVEIVAQ